MTPIVGRDASGAEVFAAQVDVVIREDLTSLYERVFRFFDDKRKTLC